MKNIWRIVLVVVFLFVSFFGLGPVLMADGVLTERLMTLFIVLLLYGLIVYLWKKISK
ncbi:hypothetical protein [Alkalibaculum bacchi]|uniref:DUF6954 family protein n=1 Tax=Alkalibaculum bacchi TaxID=645887 RepID=UPI0026EFD235|nr:hypothetical protein [Alkalibaculum bacchi]